MKQAADAFTLDLLDKPKRGRPRKPDALTPAQRARAYRARQRAARQQGRPDSAILWPEPKRVETIVLSESEWPYPGERWAR